MQMPALPKNLMDKKIPTILGMVVLVFALVAGVLLLGQGGGVFAPRATPETTPQKIKVTNVTDSGFTVSFLTDESTAGFVKYGDVAESLNSQASDDRDQLTGSIASYQTHHITVRGLEAGKTYFYTLGTGSGNTFDDGGKPFSIKTAAKSGTPAAAKTVYGTVSDAAGNPADGVIVYISTDKAGEMSVLSKKTGSWAIPLSNARTKDGSAYAMIEDSDSISITAQGPRPTQFNTVTKLVSESQPVETISYAGTATTQVAETTDETTTKTQTATSSTTLPPIGSDKPVTAATGSGTPVLTTSGTTATGSGTSSRDTIIADATKTDNTSIFAPNDTSKTGSTNTRPPQTDDTSDSTTTPPINGGSDSTDDTTVDPTGDNPADNEVDDNSNESSDNGSTTIDNPYANSTSNNTTNGTSNNSGSNTTNYTTTTSGNRSGTSTQIAAASTKSPSPTPFGSGNPYPANSTGSGKTATGSATATASSKPSTQSAMPVSGSVGTTLALIFGGMFFITSGFWSFWVSREIKAE